MKQKKLIRLSISIIIMIISLNAFSQITLNTPNTNSILYLGEGENQPLIVGLGGSEGGNAWASEGWGKVRDQFVVKGYAFLALGYFGGEGMPDTLNLIAIENIHYAIAEASKNPKINKKRIAIIGGSTGAELALVMGSYYKDIKCVIGLVPSHAVFPGHTMSFSTSCWTYKNKELPFVPATKDAIPFIMNGEMRKAFEEVLKDTVAEQKALIMVEKIKGPILLISAKNDEVWPSTPMSEKVMARLSTKKFKYHFEHVAIEGGHSAPLKQFGKVIFPFLEKHFPVK
ncbi:MAG: hypothetical protein KKG99_07260 [Bacteroidetes bacterium]|nr:hypothetical protein [Bacteroidota bacterium]